MTAPGSKPQPGPSRESGLMSDVRRTPEQNPRAGIAFILIAVVCISINDMTIKLLSGAYPLHQIVFVRSAIGIVASLTILQFEGGLAMLRTDRPWLHVLRGLLIVVANMTYFAALAIIPLADATALFYVAPLLITLLAIPFLGEQVGVRRLAAVGVGFLGVLVMLRPGGPGGMIADWVLMLPIVAAFAYAAMQILTRRLGVNSKPSAMAIYIQAMFLVVSIGFWILAGDGRYEASFESESMRFLLRAWIWPETNDWTWFIVAGLVSAAIGYSLSRAYSAASPATVAPFEYLSLPLAMIWGWVMFAEVPGVSVYVGVVLIAGSGIYVFARESRKDRPLASRGPTRRT